MRRVVHVAVTVLVLDHQQVLQRAHAHPRPQVIQDKARLGEDALGVGGALGDVRPQTPKRPQHSMIVSCRTPWVQRASERAARNEAMISPALLPFFFLRFPPPSLFLWCPWGHFPKIPLKINLLFLKD